ncbi:MAG: nucleotidyltransferase domain-containing protein [Candidatus Kryptoniota bacterium]
MGFENDARATLLYFDLFDHPLTREELFRFFPAKISFEDFNEMLDKSTLKPSGGLFHIRKTDEIAYVRKNREKKARSMLFAAKLIGGLVRYFPFVRAVFLSGSLSKGVNAGGADVDLFIISEEERLWICRSFLIAFKKIFLFNKKKFLCPNYFLTELHLEIPEKNIFTATELITLKPLFNEKKLYDLFAANQWISYFYPNFKFVRPNLNEPSSPLQWFFELPMSDGHTAKWDNKLMHYFNGLWERRYPAIGHEKREFLFRTTPHASKIHPNDFQTKTLNAFEEKLRKENLERLTRLDD